MQPNRLVMREAVQALRKVQDEIYPVLAFYGLYIGVIELYKWLQAFMPLPAWESSWIMFVTSPFSYFEAVGKTPTQTTQGLLNNFLFPAEMMVLAILYNIFLSRRFRLLA